MSKKKNLDVYLSEVFKQFVVIKNDDLKKSQEVFKSVFNQVKQKMGEQCNYFKKYSSQVLYAGSVYDGIKVSKMDEFDMDIVIRLPINYDDGPNGITFENHQPGYVKMKITNAFDNLDKQPEWEKCHKITKEWRDEDKYFLQNKFRAWIHGLVQKALNELKGHVDVNGTMYLVSYKESGPAYTLNIKNKISNEEFKLDVDMVPVIRFMHPRWPEGYRVIEGSQVRDWLLVPKPNKALEGDARNRCWRLSFQDYERVMMKGCQQLKMTIMLLKKLRDGLELTGIASYYIKTLFLWEIDEVKNKRYWEKKISVIFRAMVEKLYKAILNRNIPYFWHKEYNLIEGLKPSLCKIYSDKLKEVLNALDANNVDKIVEFILTAEELQQFKRSEFCQKMSTSSTPTPWSVNNILCVKKRSVEPEDKVGNFMSEQLLALTDKIHSIQGISVYEKFTHFEKKVKDLEKRLTSYEDRLMILETKKTYHNFAVNRLRPSNNVPSHNSYFNLNQLAVLIHMMANDKVLSDCYQPSRRFSMFD